MRIASFMKRVALSSSLLLGLLAACQNQNRTMNETKGVGLIILDPGHFHAALMQKSAYPEIDSVVHVYAPDGPDVKSYLKLINGYNTRQDNPTNWHEDVYTAPDYLQKMLDDKKGNVVLISGNNRKKSEYIRKSVEAGYNVLADKPMAIDSEGFEELEKSFDLAQKNKLLLYDIMTERYEIANILQKEFSQNTDIFGELEKGTLEHPAISMESVHYYYKMVSGSPLVRPQWFFDPQQAGDGLVDITTHLVDLVQWQNFSDAKLNKEDVQMLNARHWPTPLTLEQFTKVTQAKNFPEFLKAAVKDGKLNAYSNGEMNYTLKGIHTKLVVTWDFESPGGSDTHYSQMRGTKANLIIRQGKEQGYKPTLFVEPLKNDAGYDAAFKAALQKVAAKYPGLETKASGGGWEIIVPESYKVGHEAHFAEVAKKYLGFLKEGKIPDREVAAMITKYYTTTQALQKAESK